MPVDEPGVIESPVDPEYECVPVGGSEHLASPPPGPPADDEPSRADGFVRLCPDGYVPRRKRRPPYELDGKRLRRSGPAEHNPAPMDEDASSSA